MSMTKLQLLEAIKDFPDDAIIMVDGSSMNYYTIQSVSNSCFPNKEGKEIIQLFIQDIEEK